MCNIALLNYLKNKYGVDVIVKEENVKIKPNTHTSIKHATIFHPLYGRIFWVAGQKRRVFANGPRDRGSIPSQVLPKTQKMILNASLLSTIR